jgi:hypothetical protein
VKSVEGWKRTTTSSISGRNAMKMFGEATGKRGTGEETETRDDMISYSDRRKDRETVETIEHTNAYLFI